MTDLAPRGIFRVVRRLPVSILILLVLLGAGFTTGALWSPFQDNPLWNELAYGLPAFQAGRWWTPLTGTLLAAQPLGYLLLSF